MNVQTDARVVDEATELGRGDLASVVNQGYDAASGTEVTFAVTPEEMRCSIREEVQLKSLCAAGACNANGLCSFKDAPDIVLHDAPKPIQLFGP